MTTLIAWFLWIGMLVVIVLLVADLIATKTAVKVVRHVEALEEAAEQHHSK